MASEFAGQTCGIYPRVSSHKQAKKDRSSIRDQLNACRDYAAEKGMIVDEDCVRPEAYTSRVMKRPELNVLLAKMKEKQVPNLIIDRVDRMTRGGVVPAMMFLQQFTRAHILLHVVSAGDKVLLVRDDEGVKKYVDAAYDAQQANKGKTRIVMRAKRSRARDGYFIRGNKPPFGFRYVPCEWDEQGNVVNKRHEPDERPFADLGFPTTFAPTPYAARREMLRLYADGLSSRKIADRMTNAGVPTPWVLVGWSTPPKVWHPRMVTYLVSDSINEGILTNFRATYTIQDPDDKHDEEWMKIEPVPLDKQIKVTPAHGSPAPLLDEATAARLKQRRESPSAFAHPRQTVYAGRPLLAGRVTCARCGGGMRVRSVKRPSVVHFYYSCTRHDMTPTACVGLSLSAQQVDPRAWAWAVFALTRMDQDPNADNYLDVLARRQADLPPGATPAGQSLADLKATRAYFAGQVVLLTDDLAHLTTTTGREVIRQKIDQFQTEVDESDRKILAYERQAALRAERQAVLNGYLHQYHRYHDLLYELRGDFPGHLSIMAHILKLVGAQFTLGRDTTGKPTVHVDITITPQSAEPWFTAEQEQLLEVDQDRATRVAAERAQRGAVDGVTLEEGLALAQSFLELLGDPDPLADRVVESSEESTNVEPKHPPFPPPGYSSRRW